MGAVEDYAFLNALVSVMADRLRTRAQITALVQQPVADWPAFFSDTGLDDLSLDDLEPETLEQALIRHLCKEADELSRPLTGVKREIIRYWIRRFEIGNLKAIIRGKLTGQPKSRIRENLLGLDRPCQLPTEDLLGTEDAAELLRSLEPTPYGDLARQARRIYEDRKDLFTMEAAIDRSYFAGLEKRVNSLPTTDRQAIRPLLGSVVDQINLVWLLRYRFAYALAPPHAYFLLSPSGYRVTSGELLELVKSASLADALQRIDTLYRGELGQARTITEMEGRLEAMVWRRAHYVLTHTTFNLARPLAYLWLREKQLLAIHAVLKGRLLQLNPAIIERAILESAAET
jgi:V/A-type H+-transporting ATPase subunit C